MEEINSQRYNFFLKGTDTLVLLIHGITGTPSEMRYLGKTLNKAGFSVFCGTLPRHCSTLEELKKVTWREIADACKEDFLRLSKEYRQVFVGGLSMGAVMAVHLAYEFPSQVRGIIAFAPTFFYDGWALHKAKALMHLVWHIPFLRNMINIRESSPYGLKDGDLRQNIERFYKNAKASEFSKKVFLFGSPFFPLTCLYQHHLFVKSVKKELFSVKTPIIIFHAREDDMVSIANARYLLEHIGSADKRLVVLEDSYHMITIDREKDLVAQEVIKFLNKFPS
jgi:carboxylesterase